MRRTLNLLLAAALLSTTGCAGNSWRASQKPLPPVDCDADALAYCEPPEIESENATLGDAEEVDAINRERWLRCVIRHRAALQCFDALRKAGYVGSGGAQPPEQPGGEPGATAAEL